MYFILLNYNNEGINTRGWFHNGFLAYDITVPVDIIKRQCPNVELVYEQKEPHTSLTSIITNTANFISLGDHTPN